MVGPVHAAAGQRRVELTSLQSIREGLSDTALVKSFGAVLMNQYFENKAKRLGEQKAKDQRKQIPETRMVEFSHKVE